MPSGIGYDQLSTLTPQQQQMMNQLMMGISGIQSGNPLYQGQSQDVGNAYRTGLQANPSASISPEATARYIQQSVASPLLRAYDQVVAPRMRDAYASVGALMGSRRGFAQQQGLQALQGNIATELGRAQLSNQQLSANLQEQMAQRQLGAAMQQQQIGLQAMGLGANLTGQSQMAIQPYRQGGGGGIPQYQPQSQQSQQQSSPTNIAGPQRQYQDQTGLFPNNNGTVTPNTSPLDAWNSLAPDESITDGFGGGSDRSTQPGEYTTDYTGAGRTMVTQNNPYDQPWGNQAAWASNMQDTLGSVPYSDMPVFPSADGGLDYGALNEYFDAVAQ